MILQLSTALLHSAEDMINDINDTYNYYKCFCRLFTNELFRNRHIFRSHLQLIIGQCYLAYIIYV